AEARPGGRAGGEPQYGRLRRGGRRRHAREIHAAPVCGAEQAGLPARIEARLTRRLLPTLWGGGSTPKATRRRGRLGPPEKRLHRYAVPLPLSWGGEGKRLFLSPQAARSALGRRLKPHALGAGGDFQQQAFGD